MNFQDGAKKIMQQRIQSKQAELQKLAVTRATQYADKLSHGLVGKVLDYLDKKPTTDIVFHSELTDDYSFIRGNGTDGLQCLQFFQAQRQMKAVMRICIIQSDGNEILNMPCVINDLSYTYDKVGDIKATIGIEEYVYTNTSTTAQSSTGGENKATDTKATDSKAVKK